jgi:hypothetical protein
MEADGITTRYHPFSCETMILTFDATLRRKARGAINNNNSSMEESVMTIT